MTDDQSLRVPEHGSTDVFEGDEARRERIERAMREQGEGSLSEEDYQFAVQHGLIEG